MDLHTAADVVGLVTSGQRVFVHGAAATPLRLLDALIDRADGLADVELIHLHTFGPARYAEPRYTTSFRVTNLFVGSNMRGRLDGRRVDYPPSSCRKSGPCCGTPGDQTWRSFDRRPIGLCPLRSFTPSPHAGIARASNRTPHARSSARGRPLS